MIRDEVRLERGMVYYRFDFGYVYAFAICADTHRVLNFLRASSPKSTIHPPNLHPNYYQVKRPKQPENVRLRAPR